jgi:hypothetical protein
VAGVQAGRSDGPAVPAPSRNRVIRSDATAPS